MITIDWAAFTPWQSLFGGGERAWRLAVLVGAVAAGGLFGIGWGLIGYCPGPALVSFGAGIDMAWWFVPAMIVGILIQRLFFK